MYNSFKIVSLSTFRKSVYSHYVKPFVRYGERDQNEINSIETTVDHSPCAVLFHCSSTSEMSCFNYFFRLSNLFVV